MSENEIDDLNRFFERLLGERGDDPLRDPSIAAEALDALTPHSIPAPAQPGDCAARMAAWLDGALDESERAAFETALACDPALRFELDANNALMMQTAQGRAAPADLVAAVLSASPAMPVKASLFSHAQAFFSHLRISPLWAGGGLASAALALAVVLVQPPPQADAPLAAAPLLDQGVAAASTAAPADSGLTIFTPVGEWNTPPAAMSETMGNYATLDDCSTSAAPDVSTMTAAEGDMRDVPCDTMTGAAQADRGAIPASPHEFAPSIMTVAPPQ